MTYIPQVGDIVVLFVGGYPCEHNSAEANTLGGSGCRGRVLKIGKKYTYISSIGSPWKVENNNPHFFILPVDQAREVYREKLANVSDQQFVDQSISTL